MSRSARSPADRRWKPASPRRGEILARDVQRPPERLAAADGDDLCAGLERVEPLGRGGEPGADDGDRRRILVRLVRVHRPRIRAQLVRHLQSRVARRDEHVPENAVAVELEAAVDGAHALDPFAVQARVPAAARAQPLDVCEELPHRWVEAVAERAHQRRRRAAAHRRAERQPRKRRRPAVAVALRAHLALPDRGRAPPERRRRIVVGAEDRDLARLELAAQGLVRREPGQAGSDDGDAHYFTEPASSPWTK